jgi:hypothetical protein
MTVIGIIVGGCLAFNVLFVVALLFRRDRPAVCDESPVFHEPDLAEEARERSAPALRERRENKRSQSDTA